MKKLKTVINTIIWTLCGIYLCTVTLLNIPTVQSFVAKETARILSNAIGAEVTVGRVDLGMLNRIIIDNVCINDRQHHKALAATRLSAKLSFTELAQGNIVISSAQIFGLYANIYRKTATDNTNIQFIIDSLASEDTSESKPLNLEIGSLVVRHGRIRYNQLNSPDYRLTAMKHIDVSNISAHVVINNLSNDSINLNIKKLSFIDKSGLEVKDFKLRAVADRHNAVIDKFRLELPHSVVDFKSVTATYDATSGKLTLPSLRYSMETAECHIALPDLKALVPQFASMDETLDIYARATGTADGIQVRKFSITTDDNRNQILLTASLNDENGTPSWNAHIKALDLTATTIANTVNAFAKEKGVPQILANIGDISFRGNTAGSKHHATLEGILATDAGTATLSADKNGKHCSLKLSTHDCNLETILNDDKSGLLDTDITLSADIDDSIERATAKGTVNRLQYNGYTYNGITIDCTLDNKTVKGFLTSDDPNIDIKAEGEFSIDMPKANLTVDIRHLKPQTLKLSDKWSDADFSAHLRANFSGTDIDNTNGSITIDNFSIERPDNSSYNIRKMTLLSRNNSQRHSIILSSDFANAAVSGEFSVQSIMQHMQNLIVRQLPDIQRVTPVTKRKVPDCRIIFYADILSAEPLKQLLGLPIEATEPFRVDGYMNSRTSELSIQATLPNFNYDGTDYTDVIFNVSTPEDKLKASLTAKKVLPTGRKAIYALNASAHDNRLIASLDFDNNSKLHVKGNMNAYAQFTPDSKGNMQAVVNIMPSSMMVDNTAWNIRSSKITYSPKNLLVDNFAIEHDKQHIHINGKATVADHDSLTVDIKGVDVAYILNLVNFHSVDFDGKATGKACIAGAFGKPDATAKLTVDKFTFEGGTMGTLVADVAWNNDEKQIDIDAKAHDMERLTVINGYVSPKKNYIDLDITAHDTRTEFMLGFCGSFLDKCDAKANGKVKLWGPLNAIELTGDLTVDGTVHVSSLNTAYTLTDAKVKLLEGRITLSDITIIDRYGNSGIINGNLYHKHLARLTYDISVKTDNLLVYDFDGTDGSTFYGKAFGTGLCSIKGKSGEVTMDIDITPGQGSLMTYNTASPDAIKSQEFIKWNDRDSVATHRHGISPVDSNDNLPSDIRINFLIHTRPTATLRLIMDNTSGDYIDLRGTGVVRATYYNKGAFELYGNYTVESGTYKLTIQNALHKDFEFTPGGTIAFGGNPYDAVLNLKAIYPVNSVSLSDLQLGRSFTSNNIRVNCLMNITGTPDNPKVDFGLDMPTVSNDAKQMIYSLMNSEEEMNQQVIYLLAVGRFYSQRNNNANADGTSQSQTSLAMQSILSGQISQQINSLLGTVINNNNWNIGANISTGDEGWNNAEYEGLLSGRLLNNRLLINGQFGYRDNANATTSFIGDFDIRYLLIPNGNIAVRVYNQSNDRYFTRNSLNTQGLGFILKKDFNLKLKKTTNK